VPELSTASFGSQTTQKEEPVEIYARATANNGVVQDEIGIEAEPVGAIGYHMIDASIVAL